MKKSIRVKKSFTLIELMLVIILLSVVSFLVVSNFNFNTQQKFHVDLENIKEFMLKNFEYEKELNLSCVEEDSLSCYIFIDDDINKDVKIENLFETIPSVYNYDKDLSEYNFSKFRLENIEYEPFFELKINDDRKHKNIVLDTHDGKVYLFSSIKRKSEIFKTTNEILDRFFELEIEVKDAL